MHGAARISVAAGYATLSGTSLMGKQANALRRSVGGGAMASLECARRTLVRSGRIFHAGNNKTLGRYRVLFFA